MLVIVALKHRVWAINRVLITSLFVILLLQVTVDVSSSALTVAGRDPSLTGRVPLWGELIRIGSAHPILGSGIGDFWTPSTTDHLWQLFEGEPESSHNGYINIYLEFGLAGLALMAAVLCASYRSVIQHLYRDFNYGKFRLAFWVMIAMYNFAETSFCRPLSMLWLVFVIIALEPLRSNETQPDTPAPAFAPAPSPAT
jgi:O-antigen ligase